MGGAEPENNVCSILGLRMTLPSAGDGSRHEEAIAGLVTPMPPDIACVAEEMRQRYSAMAQCAKAYYPDVNTQLTLMLHSIVRLVLGWRSPKRTFPEVLPRKSVSVLENWIGPQI